MKRHLLMAALVIIAPAAYADDDSALEKQCKISRARAQEIALQRVSGAVVDTDIEKSKDGKCYWSVEVKPAAGVKQEVHIDSESGDVLSVAND